jgi:transcription initiation factor IIE alpha subunit
MPSVKHEDSFVKIANLIGGEEYLKVARALLNTEDATDEEIASATGLRINIIRKVLYDMFGKALITGIRVKDVQNKIKLTTLLIIRRKKSLTDYKNGWNTKNLQNSITAEIKAALVSNLIQQLNYSSSVTIVIDHSI